MTISTEFLIDTTNKRIYHDNGTTVYTVRQLYSMLMDAFDAQGAMDDEIPMTAQTPTAYTMVNGWFIDDVSTHFLKEGAIETTGYNAAIQVVTMQSSGYTSCVLTDIGLTVHSGAETDYGELLAYNNTIRKWWVRGVTQLPISTAYHVHGGSGIGTSSIASVTGEDLYANIYTLGTIEATGLIYVSQAGAVIEEADDWWNADAHIDILMKVKEAGTEIALGVVTIYLRVLSDLYDFYEIDLTTGGRNAVPLATFNDPDNQTVIATIMAYMANIKVHFMNGTLAYETKTGADPIAYRILHNTANNATGVLLDTGGGAGASGTFQLGDVDGITWTATNALTICAELAFDAQTVLFTKGDAVKNASSGETATGIVRKVVQDPQLLGNVGILYMTDVTGTWVNDDPIFVATTQKALANIPTGLVTSTFAAVVATGAFAHDNSITKDLDNGVGAKPYNVVCKLGSQLVSKLYEYVKALSRRECTFSLFTSTGAAITLVEGRQYQRAVSTYALKKASPLGTFAGGTFFGSRGIWIENMIGTDVEKYSLIDANGDTQNPPTSSTIKVVSMVATNDRVLVCESTGTGQTAIKRNQYTMTTQNTALDYVQVVDAIADDAPLTGVVRVVYDYGLATEGEDIYNYISIDRAPANDKFMISGVTARAYDSGDRAYNPYVDANADAGGEKEVSVKYSGGIKYVVTRVRYKGYVPFSVAGSFIAGTTTITAIRTTDAIYQP